VEQLARKAGIGCALYVTGMPGVVPATKRHSLAARSAASLSSGCPSTMEAGLESNRPWWTDRTPEDSSGLSHTSFLLSPVISFDKNGAQRRLLIVIDRDVL
jgi:hypothetical protein